MQDNNKKMSISLGEMIVTDIFDIIFYIIFYCLISFSIYGKSDMPNSVAWIPICIYVLLFHCYLYWTPGMKIFHLKYVNSKNIGGKPIWWKMILHWIVSFILRSSLIFGVIALFTFKNDSGFYWDRWFKIKVINSLIPDKDER